MDELVRAALVATEVGVAIEDLVQLVRDGSMRAWRINGQLMLDRSEVARQYGVTLAQARTRPLRPLVNDSPTRRKRTVSVLVTAAERTEIADHLDDAGVTRRGAWLRDALLVAARDGRPVELLAPNAGARAAITAAINDDELATIVSAAERCGLSVAHWARAALLTGPWRGGPPGDKI